MFKLRYYNSKEGGYQEVWSGLALLLSIASGCNWLLSPRLISGKKRRRKWSNGALLKRWPPRHGYIEICECVAESLHMLGDVGSFSTVTYGYHGFLSMCFSESCLWGASCDQANGQLCLGQGPLVICRIPFRRSVPFQKKKVLNSTESYRNSTQEVARPRDLLELDREIGRYRRRVWGNVWQCHLLSWHFLACFVIFAYIIGHIGAVLTAPEPLNMLHATKAQMERLSNPPPELQHGRGVNWMEGAKTTSVIDETGSTSFVVL